MKFRVTCIDKAGRRQTLEREGESRESAAAALRSQGWVVTSVEEIEKEKEENSFHSLSYWLRGITAFDTEMALRQLGLMIKSAITLVSALETLEGEAPTRAMAKAWKKVREKILTGASFSSALAEANFGEIETRLAEVGERSGELEKTLVRAADQLEARRNLKTAVVNALVYPVMAVLMSIAVSAYLVVWVIPKLAEFLKSGGAELPGITRALMDFSDWTRQNGEGILIASASIIATWLILRFFDKTREAQDVLLLRLPVAGKILRLSGTALFARSMQIMVESGVGLADAMQSAARLLSNTRLRRRVVEAREQVLRGESLGKSLSRAKEFLPMLKRMATVGETTGSLPETFGETASFHEMLLALAVKRLGMLIEPVMIIITGAIVGFVYIAFFMALFAIAGTS